MRLRKGERGGREKRKDKEVGERKKKRRRDRQTDRQTDTVRKVLLKNKKSAANFLFPFEIPPKKL